MPNGIVRLDHRVKLAPLLSPVTRPLTAPSPPATAESNQTRLYSRFIVARQPNFTLTGILVIGLHRLKPLRPQAQVMNKLRVYQPCVL
jgi:hypothetical protein